MMEMVIILWEAEEKVKNSENIWIWLTVKEIFTVVRQICGSL